MALFKFAEEFEPLRNEHSGWTFQKARSGTVGFTGQKNDRKRTFLQWEKMQYNQKAIRNWRNMSASSKAAWSAFASTFPQPTKADPDKFLTGYQLFLKRNYYEFIHDGIDAPFIFEPELSFLPDPEFTVSIDATGPCIDVTEEYRRNFGILPSVGQFVIMRLLPISTTGGQFFSPLVATMEVLEAYVDGLFVSFHFSGMLENIVFSLYMSKPVWESTQYPGTKFRYMGCFKPTTFLQLTDTPGSYVGEGGKIVAVKGNETGLEFIDPGGCEICLPVPVPADAGKVLEVNETGDGYELVEPGGGGLNCEDLLGCGIIQQILEDIQEIQDTLEIIDLVVDYSGTFITEWNIPSAGFTLIFPIQTTAPGHGGVIFWGDGSSEAIPESVNTISHVYASSGLVKVAVKNGIAASFSCYSLAPSMSAYLLRVIQWGTISLVRWNASFRGLPNFYEFAAGGVPNIPGLIDLDFSAFAMLCPNLTEIPSDIFSRAANGRNFTSCFDQTGIAVVPSGIFSLTSGVVFDRAFFLCVNVVEISPDIFGGVANDPSQNQFDYTFYGISGYTGALPTLWLSFTEISRNQCFFGCVNASNYGDVPFFWR